MAILSIIFGVLMLIAGISCLFTPLANTLAAGYMVAILLLVFGCVNIIRAIMKKADPLVWIMSILAIIVGVITIASPGGILAMDTWIVYTLAAEFIIQGILLVVLAIKFRQDNRFWVLELIAGILSVVSGVLSFMNPIVPAITVGMLIAFFFMENGISLISLGVSGGFED